MRLLPACVSSSGTQPISSSDPEQIIRSALRARAIRLGRASMWCASCSAVVAVYTLTLSPPSSPASAPHSGSQANTFSAASAGTDSADSAIARKIRDACFMVVSSELVRAVRAHAHDVLDENLAVGQPHARVIARVLQPHAAELAGTPVDHPGIALRVIAAEDREIRRGERA